eukprot:CAMPEP_0194138218 /NCGR_PEP_ID=MMETSP0152-20130528/8066_1 /TAXON_ID=1049557 /ORGANISM="Thalassiothrix antarctica, Strain L6-D1" /LENGTH=454 /DNA_ID=CAMNT_0038835615 /DNA_START=151 /DNA_END=1516 /DNA_ORIENTATION=-
MAPSSKKDIITPQENDVLCGRGNAINAHAGNEYFRLLVQRRKQVYSAARFKSEKRLVASSIVSEIRSVEGRFLARDSETKNWYDIGDEKARDKTSQALRENNSALSTTINTKIQAKTDDDNSTQSCSSRPVEKNTVLVTSKKSASRKKSQRKVKGKSKKNNAVQSAKDEETASHWNLSQNAAYYHQPSQYYPQYYHGYRQPQPIHLPFYGHDNRDKERLYSMWHPQASNQHWADSSALARAGSPGIPNHNAQVLRGEILHPNGATSSISSSEVCPSRMVEYKQSNTSKLELNPSNSFENTEGDENCHVYHCNSLEEKNNSLHHAYAKHNVDSYKQYNYEAHSGRWELNSSLKNSSNYEQGADNNTKMVRKSEGKATPDTWESIIPVDKDYGQITNDYPQHCIDKNSFTSSSHAAFMANQSMMSQYTKDTPTTFKTVDSSSLMNENEKAINKKRE